MTALADKRIRDPYSFQYLELVVKNGATVFHQGSVAFNGVGEIVPMSEDPSLSSIGLALLSPGAAKSVVGDGVKKVSVDLQVERTGEWWDNDDDDDVTTSDIGKMAYWVDDQTVSIKSTGRAPAGRIWAVDDKRGVLIEANTTTPSALLPEPTLTFNAGAAAPATIVQHGVYNVVLAANSTVTLPAAAPDGTRATFASNGAAAFTCTFKDETGNTTISAATTASKRFQANAVKTHGYWTVGITIGP